MAGVNITDFSFDIDYRILVNRMRYIGEDIQKSINADGVKEYIMRHTMAELINPEYVVTGATEASIGAIATGKKLHHKPCYGIEHGKKITRYAYSESYVDGKYFEADINPLDEYGRFYGEFNVDLSELDNIIDYSLRF